MDESHSLRTADRAPDSRNTEATAAAVKTSEVAVLLTGTPSLSRPFDLYRQVSMDTSPFTWCTAEIENYAEQFMKGHTCVL